MVATAANSPAGTSLPERMPVVVIIRQVLEALLERIPTGARWGDVFTMDHGLHRVPSKMTEELQQAIDALEEPLNIPEQMVQHCAFVGAP